MAPVAQLLRGLLAHPRGPRQGLRPAQVGHQPFYLLRKLHHALRRPAGLEPVQHREEIGQLQQRQLAGEAGVFEPLLIEILRQAGHRLGPPGAEGFRFAGRAARLADKEDRPGSRRRWP